MHRPPSPIHVVLADDHGLVRSGIRSLLDSINGVQVIAEAADGNELLGVLDSVRPDVVITDVSMPGMDGLTAIGEIRSRHPGVKIIVLSMHDSPEIVKRAIASGANAYLRKDASEFELGSALQTVMTTGSYISSGVAKLLLAPTEPDAGDMLTPRQLEILKLLVNGSSSKEVGFALGLSSKTVDVHRSRIMDRLDMHDLPSLTRWAVRKGILKL